MRSRLILALLVGLGALVAVTMWGPGAALAAPNAVLLGQVLLEGRTDFSGTQIYFDGVPYTLTNNVGEFALAVSDGGLHSLRAKRPGYLSREIPVINPTGFITIPPTTLVMGDANGDDRIDLADLIIVSDRKSVV